MIAAPSDYVGAAALALRPDDDPRQDIARDERSEQAAQPALFAAAQQGRKVIPFEQVQRQANGRLGIVSPPSPPAGAPSTPPKVAAPRAAAGKKPAAPVPDAQTSLDFILAPPAKTRTLKTNVEAQVYCDQPVATPMHRFVAGAIDVAFILLGFGLFVIVCQAVGGAFGQGRMFWISLAAAFALVSLFYGLVWAIAGRETAGMRMTDLQLITFDGFPVDGPARALRLVATWLSFCSAGIGIIWSLADEESLTWQDHISKTFPTIREVPRNFVRR